ncbi:MAG: papain-like cysteine protease family protein [Anaerolineales bacterium]|jgi:hypothetical protein
MKRIAWTFSAVILAVTALAFLTVGAHADCSEGDPDCPLIPPQSRQVSISTSPGQEADKEDLFEQVIEPIPFSMPLPNKISPVNNEVMGNQNAHPVLNTIEVDLRRQDPSDVSCGIQALGMALEPLRSAAPSSDAIFNYLQSNDYLYEFGTGVEELAYTAQSFGYEGSVAFHNWTLENLRGELNAGRPVVIDLGANGPDQPGHFVTLTGISDDWQWVHYSDPILGERTVQLAEFMRLWEMQGRSGLSVAVSPPSVSSPDYTSWAALAAAMMATLALGPGVLEDLRRRGAGGSINPSVDPKPPSVPDLRPHDPPPPKNPVKVKIPIIETVVVGERVIGGHWEQRQQYVAPHWETVSPGHWEWQEQEVAYTAYRPKSILVEKVVNVVKEVTEKVTTWVKKTVVQPVTQWVKKTVWKPVTKWVRRTKTWFQRTWLGKWIRKTRSWVEKKVSWVKKTVWKPVKKWVTKKIVEPVTTFVKRKVIEPVKTLVRETIMQPYTAYRTEKVEVWSPPVKRYIPGHYKPKKVWVEETIPITRQVTLWDEVYVDAGDLPAWTVQDFFEKLGPSLSREQRLALFNRFQDTFGSLITSDPDNMHKLYVLAHDIFMSTITESGSEAAMQNWRMVDTWALSLRSEAGSGGDVLSYLDYGQYIHWTQETQQIGDTTWYKVQYIKDGKLLEGWVSGTYLKDYVPGSSKALLDFQMNQIFENHGIELQGTWSLRDKRAAAIAIDAVAAAFARELGVDGDEAFRQIFDNLTLLWGTEPESGYLTSQCRGISAGGCTSSAHMINFGSLWSNGPYRPEEIAFKASVNNVVHELGHAFGNLWWTSNQETGLPVYSEDGPYADLGDSDNAYLLDEEGFQDSNGEPDNMWRQHPEENATPNEVFADMFLGWVYGEWLNGREGNQRRDYMDKKMTDWLRNALENE